MSDTKFYSNELVAHDLALEFLKTLTYSSKEDLLEAYQETYKFFYEELTKPKSTDQETPAWAI